jgi:CRISPR-associated endonuclease/helicase Cas3
MDGIPDSFDGFFERATGHRPYPFQRRLAEGGLPAVLRAPTGAGKTAAAVLPWLFRRTAASASAVRRSTPSRLAVALPMRSLVEQTVGEVRDWVARLGLHESVAVAHLLGGETARDTGWRLRPSDPVVLIGTIDMLLSRALNRGYAMGKGSWPIDFGLVGNDIQWVFDEVQLMGPALPTSRQLQAFRDAIGTYGPTRSMWMSATIELSQLATVDAPTPSRADVAELSDDDLAHPVLLQRLAAVRKIAHLPDGEEVPAAVGRLHRPGTRTIVVHNTVRRAQQTYSALTDLGPDVEIVLVHSRFRPSDRAAAMQRVLAEPTAGGTVVVTTQALEAGVDISSSCLVTELAPWSSIVQRAGRCNRCGEVDDAELVWTRPEEEAPYDAADLDAAEAALRTLAGRAMTGTELAAHPVEALPPEHLVLRRKDLLELFDTAPDLSGNDIDVGRFIRDADEVDVRVAWREVVEGPAPPRVLPTDTRPPTRDEFCSAPIAAVRKLAGRKGGAPLWRFDDSAGHWARCRRAADIVPGSVLLADASLGRYDPRLGWADTSTRRVPPITGLEDDPLTAVDGGPGEERQSAIGAWVLLEHHLEHARAEALRLVADLGEHLPEDIGRAVVRAAALHDVGKAHPVFQDTMLRSAGDEERGAVESGGPWAKSSRRRPAGHKRKAFSHALAGALVLGDPAAGGVLTDVGERDLVRYLVAAHHGRVRLGIRAADGEGRCSDGNGMTLGVCEGEELPQVATPAGVLPAIAIDLAPALLGGASSWTATALRLRDRPDLGVFRLAFLEALVRLADWRASAQEAADP